MKFKLAHVLGFILIAVLSVQCKGKGKEGQTMKDNQTSHETPGTKLWQPPAASNVDPNKKYFAIIKTTKGNIKVQLYPKEAPLSVTNFANLAQKHFYKGLTFHRVVPNFVVQGGDPTGTGTGGPGYTIPAEIGLKHQEGALAWARLPETDPMGRPVNPEKRSSGSQFYITLAPQPSLDGGYTVFGQTVEGLEIAKQMQRGDVIEDVEIEVE